jgi:hypothetical protein
MSANSAKGTTRRRAGSGGTAAAIPNSKNPSGKRGSAHHSLRRLVAYYPELRMESPDHSLWRALRDDLNDSSYQGTVIEFSIFQPYEVALVG